MRWAEFRVADLGSNGRAFELAQLGRWITAELPAGQAEIARALLVDGPEFTYPQAPVSYAVIASALGITKASVATQLRRIARRHPELWAAISVERSRRLVTWHAQVQEHRRERSRTWGKRRWASRYRAAHGVWPWDDHGHTIR